MSKFFKVTIIALVIIFGLFYTVQAADIDMNLVPNEIDENSIDSNATTEPGANLIDTNTVSDENNQEETPTYPNDNIGGTVAPSGVSSIAQENMSFSNILNILVITVGVILILLAIAILVRLKG